MNKAVLTLSASLLAICGIGFGAHGSTAVFAEDSVESSETSVDSSEELNESYSEESSHESSLEEVSSEEISSEAKAYRYVIKQAHISYRNSESESYADGEVGAYYLSADGWNDEEADVVMTVNGNVVTKIESKVLYIYQYKVSSVTWCGKSVPQQDDKTYHLWKPAEEGEYDLGIFFTRELIVNPADVASINWKSLLTVQNLMTIGAWLVIVIGIFVLYGLHVKYKKRGSTTLEEVKKSLNDEIESVMGEQVGKKVEELLSNVVSVSYEALLKKVSSVDDNVATLIRCLIVMQENTPEARLAVTEYLAKLDKSNDALTAKVKDLIDGEIAKYEAEAKAKKEKEEAVKKALDEAKKTNDEWKEKASEDAGEGYDGTSI